jgi:hypothetical protein
MQRAGFWQPKKPLTTTVCKASQQLLVSIKRTHQITERYFNALRKTGEYGFATIIPEIIRVSISLAFRTRNYLLIEHILRHWMSGSTQNLPLRQVRSRMKKIILMILAVSVAAAGIYWVVKIRRPPERVAKADFCEHLKRYGEAVAALRSINQDSTLEELEDARLAVQESWEDMRDSSFVLNQTRLESLQASHSDLENAIQNISLASNLEETQTEDIYLAALNALAKTLAADQVTCGITLESSNQHAVGP